MARHAGRSSELRNASATNSSCATAHCQAHFCAWQRRPRRGRSSPSPTLTRYLGVSTAPRTTAVRDEGIPVVRLGASCAFPSARSMSGLRLASVRLWPEARLRDRESDERRPARTPPPPLPQPFRRIPAAAAKPTVAELLATPHALLSRGHLRELGLERRAIDAIFNCPVVALPGYRRPLIRVADYRPHRSVDVSRRPSPSMTEVRVVWHGIAVEGAADFFFGRPIDENPYARDGRTHGVHGGQAGSTRPGTTKTEATKSAHAGASRKRRDDHLIDCDQDQGSP